MIFEDKKELLLIIDMQEGFRSKESDSILGNIVKLKKIFDKKVVFLKFINKKNSFFESKLNWTGFQNDKERELFSELRSSDNHIIEHENYTILNDELKKITILIDQDQKNQRADTEIESFMGEVRIVMSISRFKETPESSFRSTTLEELKRGDKVLLLGLHDENYFKAQYLGRDGYIHRRYFDEDNEEYRDYYISQLKKVNTRMGNLVERYGLQDGRRIYNGRYWLGMTKDMARASLGTPTNINRSAHAGGMRREQWVYRSLGLYLYFDGNILSSYQKRD